MGPYRTHRLWLSPVIITLAVIIGCGGRGGPLDPGLTARDESLSDHNGQVLWALYDIRADASTGQVDIVPLRNVQFQSNATRFLQPPASPTNLLGVSVDIPGSDIPNGMIACDVSIKHPFPGTKFWGFDVRGIVMGGGSGEVELLNADGYTRWWNPTEFTTVGTIFGYTEGIMSPPGALPTTLVHPYKYFADSLGPDDPMVIDPASRGAFNPNDPGKVSRRYELQFPDVGGKPDFHFKYAITASWEAPDGSAPWEVSDFPIGANQPEAYQVSILDDGSTLYREGASFGGDLKLRVTVYDWQKPYNPDGMPGELGALKVECASVGLSSTDILPTAIVSAGPDFNSVSYQFAIEDLAPSEAGLVDVWVIAESANVTTYAPDIGGITGFDYPEDAVLSAYNKLKVEVSDTAPPDEDKMIHVLEPNCGEIWEIGTQHDIKWESAGPISLVKIEYSLSDTGSWNGIVPSTPNDGVFEWEVPDTPSETARVRVSDASDPLVNDISDCYFLIVPPQMFIYVDDSSTSPDEFGTMQDPFKTITAAISTATAGDVILVDDSGETYTESVVLTDGISVFSENWDPIDGTDRASIQTPDTPGACTISADGIDDASISGFNVRPGGSFSSLYGGAIVFAHLANCSNLKLGNCYFNGEEMERDFTGVYVENCSDVEIFCSTIEHLHGPDSPVSQMTEFDECIFATNTPNLYIHNVRMNHLGVNFNPGGHIVDGIYLDHCDNAVLHNNLVYRIEVASGGEGAALVTGFTLEYCGSPTIFNNTVNFLDTVDNFFINQAFCYFLVECPNGVFYNNIATNVTESGWAPDGSSLGRGVQSYLYDLPCDYTLTWNIEAPYFQQAFPDVGCVEAQPMFIDPENGLHDIDPLSAGQQGSPDFVDWDDTGAPSGDPGNPDTNTRSRMGCHGGPYGASVGCVE